MVSYSRAILLATSIVCALLFSVVKPAQGSANSIKNSLPASHAAQDPIWQAGIQGEAVCAQAPSTFTPLKASAEEIAYYGFPSKPKGAKELALWLQTVTEMKHRSCGIGKPLKYPVYHHTFEQVKFAQKPNNLPVYADQGANWSGVIEYLSDPSNGIRYTGAQADLQTRCNVDNGYSGPPLGYVSWVGIGGVKAPAPGQGSLWQAGWDGVKVRRENAHPL